MNKGILNKKSYSFAIRIVNLVKYLQENKEYILSKQLLRSGTAIGALVSESEYAQSKADFVNKLSIALKESNDAGALRLNPAVQRGQTNIGLIC